jgi:penicillin-binding protein 2B
MIQALTSVTNDGTTLKPYIIDKIVDPNTGKVVYEGKRTEKNKVYSTATVNKITELMDMTVNGSDSAATGKVYETPSVRLIGKTGTANYIGENGKYVVGSYNVIRSFAGVFPKDNPEYIIYVVVKDFHGTSKNMGAIVKDLVESVAKYKNLDERVSDKDESKIVKVDNYLNTSLSSATTKINNKGMSPIIIGNGNTVVKQMPERNTKISSSSKIFLLTNGSEYVYPDVTGWSSSELITFCNLVGIKYELNGYGYVVSTNIVPGAIINKEDVITANLENIQPSSLIKPKVDEQNDKDKKTS